MIKEIKENEFEELVLKSKEKVIVDFYANWCGPCKMLRPILEEVAKDGKIKIMSIDVDEAESLSQEYGIISIPCVIMFQDGKEVTRSIGLKSKNDLESVFQI